MTIYRGDPNQFAGGTNNFSSYAAVNAFVATLPVDFTGTTTANGNTGLNFNVGGQGGQAFNGSNGPGNIGYTNGPNAANGNNGGNDYTAILSGYVYLPAGTSTLATRSDDGSMLFIDGQTVVSNNNYQGPTTQSGPVTEATAGYHQIEIGYYQGGGGAGLGVYSDAGNTIMLNSQLAQVAVFSNAMVASGNATIDLIPQSFASFPSLTIGAGGASTLHVTTGPGTATFGTTTIANTPIFDVQGSNVLNLGTVTDNGSGSGLTKQNTGTLVLPNANTYGGTTTISGGNVVAGTAQSLGTGPIHLNGGQLSVSGGVPGLQEGWLNGGFNQTDGMSAALFPSIQLSPRAANWTTNTWNTSNGTTNWVPATSNNSGAAYTTFGTVPNFPNNTTVLYQGYMYFGQAANSTVSFVKNFDDEGTLFINGTQVVADTGWNTLGQGSWTVPAPGWYPIVIRFGQGGGGAGPNIANFPFGFGYDPNGNGGSDPSQYYFPTDSGNGALFTSINPGVATFNNPLSVTSPSSLNVTGVANFAGGTSLGSVLTVTGSSPAGTAVVNLQVGTTIAGASGLNVASGVNVVVSPLLGDGGTAATFTASGAGYTTLAGNGTYVGGSNFQVNSGNLIAVGQNLTTGPLGGRPITLTNGTLYLVNPSAAATTFDPISGNHLTLAGKTIRSSPAAA